MLLNNYVSYTRWPEASIHVKHLKLTRLIPKSRHNTEGNEEVWENVREQVEGTPNKLIGSTTRDLAAPASPLSLVYYA